MADKYRVKSRVSANLQAVNAKMSSFSVQCYTVSTLTHLQQNLQVSVVITASFYVVHPLYC